jgi:amidohydrolase
MRRRVSLGCMSLHVYGALFALLYGTTAAAQQPAPLDALLQPEQQSLDALYKHLHANPELSYHEKETAARIAAELTSAGFTVTTGVGGHGIVGVLKNGAGKTVLVRTDLDALPVTEKTNLPYASKIRTKDEQGNDVGVMHACGHDVHMTAFVGTARLLAKLKNQWSGTVVMIGQPAEERGGGAEAMLKDGLFRRFPRPDYCLALHTDAALQTGRIGYREGPVLASVDSVDVTIRGVGGHGAYPHLTKDPVMIAAQFVMALQTIVSREVRPIDTAVVTVGSIHGGTKHNIIPDQVDLQLTVRAYTEQTREQILTAIRRIAVGVARTAGVPADREPIVTNKTDEYTPATSNDPPLGQRLLPVWRKLLGEQNVILRDPEMGGEDFSRYGLVDPKIPIFMFRVGTIDPERMNAAQTTPLPSLHSALYWPTPHPTIETGVKAMTAAVMELLGK